MGTCGHLALRALVRSSTFNFPVYPMFQLTPKFFSEEKVRGLCRPLKSFQIQPWHTMSSWTWLCVQGHSHAGTGLEQLVPVKENLNATWSICGNILGKTQVWMGWSDVHMFSAVSICNISVLNIRFYDKFCCATKLWSHFRTMDSASIAATGLKPFQIKGM